MVECLETIRLASNLTQARLTAMTGPSPRTINRPGKGDGTSLDFFIRVLTALGLQTDPSALLPDPAVRPGERVALGREHRQARPLDASATPANAWQWAEYEPAND